MAVDPEDRADDGRVREKAADMFKKALALTDDDLVDDDNDLAHSLRLMTFASGEVLVQEETVDRNFLFMVLGGCVSVLQVRNLTRELACNVHTQNYEH